ncbi:carboxymuconolactone decarboxylase family protein [Pseudophaeobacter sp.]|uniref:carboxymuconolactone decarboxylase family protein n=1 Tax=Pseudophaeobacter sp. TaxID=1971739 RepID=UPI00329A3B76
MDWKTFMTDIEGDIAALSKEIPDTVQGFGLMGKAAKTDGALDQETKEYMALGIAIATRCDSCIGFHVRALVQLNISREAFCEALSMATYMGGGPSFAYSAKALAAFDRFSKS